MRELFNSNRKKIFGGLIFILVVALISLTLTDSSQQLYSPNELGKASNIEVSFFEDSRKLGNLSLETAYSLEELEEGLMNRTELGSGKGMLFVYNKSDMRNFWMKNTYIPLDIIFVSSEKDVINVEKAYPQPDTPENQLEIYSSEEPAQYVIETNQNFSAKNGISKGTKVKFTGIN